MHLWYKRCLLRRTDVAKQVKKQKELVDLPDVLASVWCDSQRAGEQGWRPGIPQSYLIWALLSTVISLLQLQYL